MNIRLSARSASSVSSRSGRDSCDSGRTAPSTTSTLIEQRQERLAALLVPRQLEERPAAFVERLFVEFRLRLQREDGGVRPLRIGVPLQAEGRFAATELGLVIVGRLRVTRDEFIERAQCLRRIPRGFVGASQLVEHGIRRRILGIILEQALVSGDRLLCRRHGARARRAFFTAQRLSLRQPQIAETTQRLGPQRRIGTLDLQEILVAARRLVRIGRHRLRAIDRHRAGWKVLQGRR